MTAILISSPGRERGRACQPGVPKGVIGRASPTPPSKKGRDAQPYLYDCCDSTMAASSHLDECFIVFFNGWTGSDGQNRVCVTLVSHDATFVQ